MANRLINETSLYLLQHANNPVDWYPYSSEAFEEARRRNCPMIISIGYSACHWCHVMESESFSVPEVAELMNRLFVCVKVDREERPDVDHIYMNAIQLLHGQGGWPLNCFALPDGSPFWGGTYFRPDQWVEVLQQLSDLYHNNFTEIFGQAERIHKGIEGLGIISPPSNPDSHYNTTVQDAYDQLALKFDTSHGGLRGAPKFPMPQIWLFVLNYYYLSQSAKSLQQFELSLEKMAMGGIFDQLAGGVARYSTDQEWKVPHFEKMLYDNAQLAILYALAYQNTAKPLYLKVMEQILDFVSKELTSNEGAFFAALDADTEGKEGSFYLWRKQEIMDLLPEYGDLLCRYWGVDKEGLWEKGNSILVQPLSDEQFASREHLSATELRQLIKMASQIMLNYRNKRVRPIIDDKIIASWNALMIKGFATAAIITGNKEWQYSALNAAGFLCKELIQTDGKINRSWKDNKSKINGFLNDYAFTADAFISLYQLTFDESWLHKAKLITECALNEFSQKNSPMFWYIPENNEDTHILNISRILETSDGVEPSGNSVLAWVLLTLGNYYENQEWIDRSIQMCSYMQNNVVAYPDYYANWASLAAALTNGLNLVVITGEKSVDFARKIQKQFHPFTLLAVANEKSSLPVFRDKFQYNRTVIYKCSHQACEAPVEKVEDISF